MKINFDSPEQEVRIELLPLIDIIFCILTFFILAAITLTRQAALNIDLPRASSGAPQMRKLLLIAVDRVGQTYVEKQAVSPDQLFNALVQFEKTNPNGKIVLSADRYASYNDVVQVLDVLKSVGGDRVALATQSPSKAGDANTYQLPNSAPTLSTPGSQPNPFPSQFPSSGSSNNPLNLSPAPGGSLTQPDTKGNSGSFILPSSRPATP